MSLIKKESSATSSVLFLNVKGEAMRFFIRPGPTKVQLQPLISNGGGVLCRTQEPNAILLADPGDITAAVESASHFYISTQYVHDCVAQNQQLDIENYRFSNLRPPQTRAASRKQKSTHGRMGYSLDDDTAILKYIAKHRKEARGNRIWQQMEHQRITSHSWQSMKDRFLKHLQHKLEQESPENKKKVLKESSCSEDNILQPTPKRTPKKKEVVDLSSDSEATQISHEHEGGTTEQPPDLQASPEEISSPQDPDEVRKPTDCDESVPEKAQQPDSEQHEVSTKRARMDTDAPTEDTSSGPNDERSTPSEKKNSRKPCATSGRKLGILTRAAREFEDSQVTHGGQEDQPLSQASSINASDTAESQIIAARERAIRGQEVNPEHPNDVEEPAAATQSHSSALEPEDDEPGPSSAALPITSNAHMFLFQQESQEELSQPTEEDQLSPSLLETKQHVVRLMQKSKKDLVEVMKALLKASGDVTLALTYLLEGHDPEVHGPIWTRYDDEMLLSADSFEFERLHEKYGADKVSKRAAFLKADL